MNFLAHAHLSGDNDDLLFGNFIADAVKGNGLHKFPDDICRGISIHRKIDSFTDTHPIFRQTLDRIRSHFGKFTGIVVDIYYDHFLAHNWEQFSAVNLPEFAGYVYRVLEDRYELLPARTRRMLPYLTSQNWLVGYANFNGLDAVFHGMDRRTGLLSGMSNAVPVLKDNYEGIKEDFFEYYPLLEEFTQNEIRAIYDADQE